MPTTDTPPMPRRALRLVPWAAVGSVCVLLAVVSAVTGVPGGDRHIGGAYLDASVESNLPTWWSTALFTVAALAHVLAAVATRTAGLRGTRWWGLGALGVAGLSVAEHTSVHDRLADSGGRPDLVHLLLAAAILAVLTAAAVGVGARAGTCLGAGAWVTVLAALGGRYLGGASVRDTAGHVVTVHLAELGENLGALLLLAGATAVLTVRRTRGGLVLQHRDVLQHRVAGPPVPATRPEAATTGRAWWIALALGCAAVSVTSAAVVLRGPDLGARPYLDVLVEDNLPTWWSTALLLVAGLAHGLAAVVHRSAGTGMAAGWAVTALLLTVSSLDDHTALHERSERIGRWLVTPGSYPFLWLIPGAVAGAVAATAVVALALRSGGRVRRLLVAGITVLLACALGLEAVQGLFMQADDEGVAFVVIYHLEELGENVAALLLLGAAVVALSVSVSDRALVVSAGPDGS